MNQTQEFSLVFFENDCLIPEEFLTKQRSYFCMISHMQGTSPFWLIYVLIENSLTGSALEVNNELKSQPNRANVVYLSFFEPKSFYTNSFNKKGLNLQDDDSFIFIDCFSDLFTKIITDTKNPDHDFDILFDNIKKKLNDLRDEKKVLFIDGFENFLFYTNIKSHQLVVKISELIKLSNLTFFIYSKNNLLYNHFNNKSDYELNFSFTKFLLKLYHKSHFNISFKKLSNEKSNDITGSLNISKGFRSSELFYLNLHVKQKNYMYQILNDLSVKIFND